MKKLVTACSIAAVLSFAIAAPVLAQQSGGSKGATKMSQSECDALWNRVDSSKSGSVSQSQAQSYISNFQAVDTNKDGNISKSEFQAGCSQGLVSSSATTGSGSGSGMGSSGGSSTTPKK
jgi:hypothetical protein